VGVRLLVCVLAASLGAAPSGWAQATDHAEAPGPHEIFSHESRLVTEGRVFAVATHDVNRDGRPDIVVSDNLLAALS